MICYYKICVILCLQAGDKSLADVVAHEIAHSWTGNLVTNKNPEHFWWVIVTYDKIMGALVAKLL